MDGKGPYQICKILSADKFISLIDRYKDFNTLTNTMLNEFVEKILVHERDRKGCRETTRQEEIYFNFVGKFVPPHYGEAELTEAEKEEIHKREERRDRLRQNYLKRKASGAQKRYEDKIKDAKKREIEVRNAAIRAEFDGAPSAVKAARTVQSGGKSGDNIKGLPITIRSKKPGYETVIPK